MRPVLHALSFLVVLVSLNACRNTTGKQASNVGPFDSHGNYVEAWADDPSKWRPYTPKGTEGGGELPTIAKTDQPPPNSVPLPTGSSTTARPTRTALATNSRPPVYDTTHLVAKTATKPKAAAEPTVVSTSSKHKAGSGALASNTSSKHKTGSDATVAKTSSKHKTGSDGTVAKTSSKPKPKPKADSEDTVAKTTASKSQADSEGTAKSSSKSKSSVAKTKPKSASGATHHTVKPGDSLYTIAASHGTTVAALKAANGLSSNMILDGKVLVVPAHK